MNGKQAMAVGVGFRRASEKSGYVVHACSILPEHVHLVIARHAYKIEQVVRILKAEAGNELRARDCHPMSAWETPDGTLPSLWARRCWKVFLDSEDDILRSIRYVENNPLKEEKPLQRWSFVVPFPATVAQSTTPLV